MTAVTSRRALLTGAAAVIPAAIAAPALASIEPPVDPLGAEIAALQKNWSAGGMRALFSKIRPQAKEFIYMLAREEELVANFKADAKLHKLWDQLQAAHEKWAAYMKGPHAKASRRFEKLAPPAPSYKGIFGKPLPAKIANQLPPLEGGKKKRTDLLVCELNLLKKIAPKHPVLAMYEKHMKALNAEWDARCKERARISEQCGLGEHDVEQQRLCEPCYTIYDKIMATRAKSMVGLKIKLDAVRLMEMEAEHGEGFASEWRSIRSDILAIAPTA